jgi:hypothetical protein
MARFQLTIKRQFEEQRERVKNSLPCCFTRSKEEDSSKETRKIKKEKQKNPSLKLVLNLGFFTFNNVL